MEEAQSLNGHVLFHPSFVTPHDFPLFLRGAVCRVVSSSMLLAAVFAGLCAVAAPQNRIGCAMASSVCCTAFYNYMKLINIREQTGTRVKLSAPGAAPEGQHPSLKLAWQELACDAVRYADWIVTLPILIAELHLKLGTVEPVWFGIPWAALLIAAVVVFGSYTRFGTDELVPPSKSQKGSSLDMFARATGLLAFIIAFACMTIVLYNLLGNVSGDNDPTNGWIYAFSLPWIAYGVVALVAIAARQFYTDGYPESLSVFKDVSYGCLDIWCKATFAIWASAHAMQLTDPLFAF